MHVFLLTIISFGMPVHCWGIFVGNMGDIICIALVFRCLIEAASSGTIVVV